MSRLGQIAYDAYGTQRGWVTFNGAPMPDWEHQEAALKTAWEAAAMAVLETVKLVDVDLDDMPGDQIVLRLVEHGDIDAPSVEGVLDKRVSERDSE